MPKKISKIISNAKNRLSSKSKSLKPDSSRSKGSSSTIQTSIGSTSDSSRLLQEYDNENDGYDNGKQQTDGSISMAMPSSYDDFESPDLNLQSLEQSATPKSTMAAEQFPINISQQKQPEQSIQGQPRKILQNLLSFGRTTTEVGTTSGYNELYTEHEKNSNYQRHWWKSDFLLGTETHGPVLFGTWNGVFVTTVVHLFGVISFLRVGWMVGNEGVSLSMAIVFGCLLFNSISLLAAIGIMERCAAVTATTGSGLFQCSHATLMSSNHPQNNRFDPEYPRTAASARANVHILIATVLGSRIGGAISIVYCIGQAVSCALHVTGFSETFVQFCAVLIRRQLISLSSSYSSSLKISSPSLSSTNDTTSIWNYGTISIEQPSLARTIARLMHIEIVTSSLNQHQQFQLILTPETFQLVSIVLILLLFIFNIVGVRWLFRLQTILFLALVAAVVDFTIGLFLQHPDYGYGKISASQEHLLENVYPNSWSNPNPWVFWRQLFETIGVFFPATIGVMAGVNMGSDLQQPTKSIPAGSFIAILSCYGLHTLFIFGLALTCSRVSLLKDLAIAQHVSAVGIFVAFGLYMSTISSGLGSMYTAPRIMQNLAQELHSVPVVRCFARGRGPNNIPINALILFVMVTTGFIMIGGINVLAPIVTIPYLLTYAAIEYAYFSMAMTFDIQIQREKRFMQIASQLKSSNSGGDLGGPSFSTKMMIGGTQDPEAQSISEQSKHGVKTPTTPVNNRFTKHQPEDTVSLSNSLSGGANGTSSHQHPPLSPSISSLQQQHLAGYGSIQSITQHIKIKRRQSTQSSDSDSEGNEFKSSKSSATHCDISVTMEQHDTKPKTTTSVSSTVSKKNSNPSQKKPKTIRQLMAAVSNSDDDDDDDQSNALEQDQDDEDDSVIVSAEVGDDEINQRTLSSAASTAGVSSLFRFGDSLKRMMENIDEGTGTDLDQQQQDQEQSERLLKLDPELSEISCKQEVWYLRLMNRWIVLIAAIMKIILMFVIAWHYTLVTLAMFALFFWIIGHTNPGFYPGVSEFSFCNWVCNCWARVKFWRPCGYSTVLNQSNMVASYSYDRIVLPETTMPDFRYESDQLTKDNTDYIDRPPCHFTTTINPQLN